ncbi:hypothetical protein F5X68DRAFT_65861 [Plectosphaerella plurivora]|uniref:Uncharacterized protein n=1 Tax=Plectosphaerella plurivora TaxID=936078 RepID=A0A9P9ACW3_9PEZI|nr:hypothetical protein F5X68DRAFT_65861 [Plectosphaerella plurivora]
MGFWDFDGASVISGKSSHKKSSHKKSSRHRSRSRGSSGKSNGAGLGGLAASVFGGDDYKKHNSSRSSFFGVPNASRSSFFGFAGGRSPSYYKRSPRGGFLYKIRKTVKKLWRDLMRLLKENPLKVVMLVIVPLITSGLLTGLLARFGLRLPAGVEKMMGLGARAAGGDTGGLMGEAVKMATRSFGPGGSGRVDIARGSAPGMQWEKRTVEQDLPWGDAISGMAKMWGK